MDLHEQIRANRSQRALSFIPPLLPTLVDEPPSGPEWSHELKYDGYRTEIVIDRGIGKAFTRNGHNWTKNYGPIVDAAEQLHCNSAIIDGEMIVQDENGRSDFPALRSSIGSNQDRLVFYAFDLLHLDGEDLRRQPLHKRRAMLRDLIGEHDPSFPIQFSESIEGDPDPFLGAACNLALEGIVSKRLDSKYRSGRQTSWLKSKCFAEGQFIVIGAEHEKGKPAFALLARETEDGLVYVGSGFVTLSGEQRDRFWNEVDRLERKKPVIPMEGHKKARWVAPEIRVEVQYLAGGDMLRHGSVRELLSC